MGLDFTDLEQERGQAVMMAVTNSPVS